MRYLHRRKKARTDKRVEIPLGKRSMRKHTRSSCHLDALPCRHITRNGPMNLGSNLLLPTLFTSCLDMLTVQRKTRSPSLLQKNSCFYVLVSIQYLSFHCINDGSLHETDHCFLNLQNLLCWIDLIVFSALCEHYRILFFLSPDQRVCLHPRWIIVVDSEYISTFIYVSNSVASIAGFILLIDLGIFCIENDLGAWFCHGSISSKMFANRRQKR